MENIMELLTIENINKEKPIVKVSVDNIQIITQVGTVTTGYFKVENIAGGRLRGRIFTSIPKLEIKETIFEDNSVEIEYMYLNTFITKEEHIEDVIEIVTNGGNVSIPIDIIVHEKSIDTVQGKIKDISQFAEYAKHNWDKAVDIFGEVSFADIFLLNCMEHINFYKLCRNNTSLDQGLEDFLIFIKQKNAINLRVKADDGEQKLLNETARNRIVVEKDTWGYVKGSIKTDASFMRVVKQNFDSDDFMGNRMEIEYYVDPMKMHLGTNEGNIYIETHNCTIIHGVSCMKSLITNVYLDKISYTQEDEAILTVENLSGKKMTVSIEDEANCIITSESSYQITSTAQIKIRFVRPVQRTGSSVKRLTFKIKFAVLIQLGTAKMRKEFILDIATNKIMVS
jgi:hypothetical protein